MEFCVGAVSRRVVEVACKLAKRDPRIVGQIIASRRQVEHDSSGYTGFTSRELVEYVRKYSGARMAVVRDHGGPNQGWVEDDGVLSFDKDLEAGFTGLHLDVSRRPNYKQALELIALFEMYRDKGVWLEVGGEHDPPQWNLYLAMVLPARPDWVVMNTGTFVWADRQKGTLRPTADVKAETRLFHSMGIRTKAHNWDWLYRYELKDEIEYVDAYNVAPELASVEIEALMAVMSPMEVNDLLNHAWASRRWERWFSGSEGTFLERAKCAARYVLETPEVKRVRLTHRQEDFIRQRIEDALIAG